MLSERVCRESSHRRRMRTTGIRARPPITIQPDGDVTCAAKPIAHTARIHMTETVVFVERVVMSELYTRPVRPAVPDCTLRVAAAQDRRVGCEYHLANATND
jgi:hypothetical protein